jgi:DNA repair protein RadD
MSALRPLREHQERAIAGLRQSLTSGRKRPMLQMPTGAGKTLTAAHLVSGALNKGKRVAFVVPRKTLIDQTVSEFEREGISAIGVNAGGSPSHGWPPANPDLQRADARAPQVSRG